MEMDIEWGVSVDIFLMRNSSYSFWDVLVGDVYVL